VNDPTLGAFAEVLADADLIVLLGKKLDFGLRFAESPTVSDDCRFIQVDPEAQVLEQTRQALNGSNRLVLGVQADPVATAEQLGEISGGRSGATWSWSEEVQAAISYRPSEWATLAAAADGPLHPVEVCRAVQDHLSGNENAVFISDGGEFGQWAQACISARRRIINGPAGAIGAAIPSAIATKFALPDAVVVAVLGDGTFGFHGMEFDTAVRYKLPFVAVVGNDAAWNAEYQIQLREYGPERLVGCELLPSRYDLVAEALGGHGENVATASELGPALRRALASGLPACVNVAIQRAAAPVTRRT
jgi:acetolactate synthase-1/2/3 large subunit